MDPFLPIIMLVIGALGLACLAWVLFAGLRRQPQPHIPPPKRSYVPPSNDEDVRRMVAALQEASHPHEPKRKDPSLGED